MKAVILAGGFGTRLGEETSIRPKPLIEIGGRPIIWHIMKYYSYFGINDFVILLGYKGYMIKEFFDNYRRHLYDMKIDFRNDNSVILKKDINSNVEEENWIIELADTGENTMTGGRLKKAYQYLKDEPTFCFTYGDGVSNINIKDEVEFHNKHKKIATVGAVYPPARFGALKIENDNSVSNFIEKPRGDNAYISGGFFVLNNDIFNYLRDDSTVFEQEPLRKLSSDNELMAFRHEGFWQCMDTQRDKSILEEMWNKGNAPWKLWK
ncbi:glucose-1-phosphate cytidylyltransferase [Brachyspira murdochii]|uniref:Glucose-1-phosphate cytidylyltransferase n=1 Tax=Brachyspira murdochii (strain ATCC 51284 / DSM 12563 / 56-150) TaxID=526224 RepID=D5U4J3_BRAM5|nr:glucose-1-phosphate cytidylyltransferase [Brachyspira murdochii]ADG70238.1 glucose-1-phosphate cytidylyltransferase [Brachyspira murdochii DSM 12563]